MPAAAGSPLPETAWIGPRKPAAAAAPNALYAPPPYAGYTNHAHLAPAFRWGWFGAERHNPQVSWHRDYNGEVVRWSRQRRY